MKSYDVTYLTDTSEKVTVEIDAYSEQLAQRAALAQLDNAEIFVSCKQVARRFSAHAKHAATIAQLMDDLREADHWHDVARIARSLRSKVLSTDLEYELECLIDTADSQHWANILDLFEEGQV